MNNKATDGGVLYITDFRLVSQDMKRLTRFYEDVLGFSVDGPDHSIDIEEMTVLGLNGAGRRQGIRIGGQHLSIDRYDEPGRRYPRDSDAASLWFQHLALVVPDVAKACSRLRDAAPISVDGPQHLPPSSGGAHAYKFRDPDGHPLELLQFPANDTPKAWRGRQPEAQQIAVGIDHSAISVNDAEASIAFYRVLGLEEEEGSLNKGPAQHRLDNLTDVEVSVVPMAPPRAPPHVELLAYRRSKGDRAEELNPNDVAATRIVWRGAEAELLRDPDGHLQQVERSGNGGSQPTDTLRKRTDG